MAAGMFAFHRESGWLGPWASFRVDFTMSKNRGKSFLE